MLRAIINKVSFRENRRRYLNLKGIINGRRAYKGPDVVQIDLTDRCNSSCSACWTHSHFLKNSPAGELAELDGEVVKNFISRMKRAGVKELIFSGGGEPFMHPDIWGILQHTQKIGLCFRINTNFTLLNDADIKRLAGFSKLISLTISVWAGEQGLYCLLHNRPAEAFFKIKHNLWALNAVKRKGLEVKLYAVISNMNYSQLSAIVDFAAEAGCSVVEFGVVDVIPGKTDRLLLDKDQLSILKEDFMKLAAGIKKKKIHLAGKELFLRRISSPGAERGEYDAHVRQLPCYAGWLFLRLRANGEFNSCLKSHRMPLGNIYKDDFWDIWNGEKQQCFRESSTSLPKDEQYFSLMGNSTDGKGCFRLCDNALVNEHFHKRLRFLKSNRGKHHHEKN